MEEKEHKIDSVAHHHHPRDPHQIPGISPVHTVSPTHIKVKHTSHALPGKDVADPHGMVLGDAAVEHDRISFAHSPSPFRKRQEMRCVTNLTMIFPICFVSTRMLLRWTRLSPILMLVT